jgi:hypothetical protein
MDRQRVLSDHLDGKIVSIEKTQQKFDITVREITGLSSQINGLDVQMNEVERSNDRAIEQ